MTKNLMAEVEHRLGLWTPPSSCVAHTQPELVAPLPWHLLPDTAVLDETGRLRIGGVDVLDLVAEVGTPVFVYDEEHLRRRCREARHTFGPWASYASKAFLCRAMARLVHEEGLTIDVSTGGEIHVALAAGVPASRLVLHGNNKSEAEIATALGKRVGRIVVDSFDEIARLERLIRGGIIGGEPCRVLVRVKPAVGSGTHEYISTGQEDSKFGFGLRSGAALAAVERLRGTSGIEVVGIHTHIGSQMLDFSALRATIAEIANFFVPLHLSELCVGGGLGVAYCGATPSPTITEWGEAVHEACRDAGIPNVVRITAEPGRSIAASAALTCYTVGTIKYQPGVRTYVSVDGGMSDNVRPALYGSHYEAFLPRVAAATRPLPVTVTGKHCESGDTIARDAHLPEDLAVGDVLATPVTGAYGYSMASNYNKLPRPPIVFVRDGTHRVVVRRETYEDLLRLDQ